VGDVYPTVRAAAVQAAAVFLDRERTTAKRARTAAPRRSAAECRSCVEGGVSVERALAPALDEVQQRRSL
jgi:hypothetical protein